MLDMLGLVEQEGGRHTGVHPGAPTATAVHCTPNPSPSLPRSLCQALGSVRGGQLRKLCKALLAGQVEAILVDVVPAAEGASPGVAHKGEDCRGRAGRGRQICG